MFKNNVKHEMGIKKPYIQNTKNGLGFNDMVDLSRRGAFIKRGNKHMDRKVRKCFPRGKAFFRMVDKCTSYHLNNT